MLKTANTSIMLGTSSWREQFIEALSVGGNIFLFSNCSWASFVTLAGDDDDDDEDEEGSQVAEKEEKEPGCYDYFMHILTVPWKIAFATIPPTDYWGGWACFVVSIAMIGVLTAVIGDLASQLGCWVGLTDAMTAISFVALGTSVPGE